MEIHPATPDPNSSSPSTQESPSRDVSSPEKSPLPQSQPQKKKESVALAALPWLFLLFLVIFVFYNKQQKITLPPSSMPLTVKEPSYPALPASVQSLVLVPLKGNRAYEEMWLEEALVAQLRYLLQEVPGLVVLKPSPDLYKILNTFSLRTLSPEKIEKLREKVEVEHLGMTSLIFQEKEKLYHYHLDLYASLLAQSTHFEVQSETPEGLLTQLIPLVVAHFSPQTPLSWRLDPIWKQKAAIQVYGLSLLAWSVQNTKEASLQAQQLVKYYPESFLALTQRIETALALENTSLKEDQIYLDQLSALFPEHWNRFYLQGEWLKALAQQKDLPPQERERYHQQALESFTQALGKNSHLYEAYEGLGELFNELKLTDFAYKAYLRTFHLRPNTDSVWYCSEYLAQQDWPKLALELYEKLLEKFPKNTEGHLRLSYFLARLDDFERATQALNSAKTLGASSERLAHYQGLIYFYQGELQKTIQEFEKALQINPDYPDALLALAHMYCYYFRELDRAQDYLNRYINHPKSRGNTPWAYDVGQDILKFRSQALEKK
jgi:tetratricopeptide (TPR) repeat protein